MSWELLEGDCLELMPSIEDKSVDMILCDLPYGTTACKWDTIIPFEPLWTEYERIIKDNGAIVLTASQPFTSRLINSNINLFRYELIWEKEQGTNFFSADKMPLKSHENVLIYYKQLPNYNPQMELSDTKWTKRDTGKSFNQIIGQQEKQQYKESKGNYRYPKSIMRFDRPKQNGVHPTQKPVALFEYLIKTYTNENDLVLDNCAGSGTTGVACHNLNRNCILIEQDPHYCEVIKDRMRNVTSQTKLTGENIK
jgi:site-specific DNA-methyltransferase (adenine-specific)